MITAAAQASTLPGRARAVGMLACRHAGDNGHFATIGCGRLVPGSCVRSCRWGGSELQVVQVLWHQNAT